MERQHIAVFTLLGNGHVYPVLPLCAELVKHGHRVTYATNEQYAPLVAEVGAETVLFRRDANEKMTIDSLLLMDESREREMEKSWQSHFFAEAAAQLLQVDTFYRENAPDLILYDRYHLPGRILAKRLDIPLVQISPHFAHYNNLACRVDGVCQNPEAIVEWSKKVDAFLSTHGISTPGSFWHIENLNIHFIPREFQHNGDWFDERFCFVGSLLDRPFRPMWTDTSNGRPIILISGASLLSGTRLDSSDYFDILIDALSGLPYHCVLSLGDGDLSRTLPPNFELNRHASHLEILPHAALSICHGGMGSVLEAVYNGVPVLMIPLVRGCEEVAYRTQELGIGVGIPKPALSLEGIRSAVSEMLHDLSLRNRVKSMRDIFRRSGGAELAMRRIETYLAESAP